MLLLLSWDDVKLRPLWQWFYFVFVFVFIFIPHPAEYGAEEFSPDAVPTLGLVRIGFGREGYLGGVVSLPRYGPLRSDAIL